MKIISAIQQKTPFYSLEFFPPKEKENWPKFFATVEALRTVDPLFISVTYGAGGGTQTNTLAITKELAAMDLLPMAHLTCVGGTKESLRTFLKELEAANVTNVLALRGDPPQGTAIDWSKETFSYANELAEFIREEFPHFGIGVSAYPTPHPQSESFAADREATRNKLENSADFAVTQLFFDPREYIEYIAQMKKSGVTKPIIPGVLPVQSFDSLKRVLSLSGCNIPAKLYLALEAAHEKGGAAAVKETGISFAVEQIKRLLDGGAPGIHLYTLNQADTCLRIVEEVGRL